MTARDAERAKALLRTGNYTCVLCKGDVMHISMQPGIAPMVEFLSAGTDLRGFSAADLVVGRAAAMLFALAGVARVHARLMSEPAGEVLRRHGIEHSWDELAPSIANRTNTGPCPMEQAVAGIEDPAEAYEAIARQIESFSATSRKAAV